MVMEADELDFLQNLKAEFVDEGLEHVDNLEGAALAFERDGDVEEMSRFKRQLHSFKGSAQAVEEEGFAECMHEIESKLERCIQESRIADFMGFVYPCIDKMRNYINSLEEGGDPVLLEDLRSLVKKFS